MFSDFCPSKKITNPKAQEMTFKNILCTRYDHVPTLLLLVANLYFFASTAWVLFYGFWAEKRPDS